MFNLKYMYMYFLEIIIEDKKLTLTIEFSHMGLLLK